MTTSGSTPPPVPDPRALAPARKVLREVFGYPEFRPGQPEVIAAVLKGRDTLAVMPTGGGKSVCYQIPALLFESGVTVVVSPLLALMKDQVDALRQAGVAAAAINSTVSAEDQAALRQDVVAGKLQLLYVAPERFGDGAFMAALRSTKVALLAIDEAHCISQWGHDFRPSYRDLGGVRPKLGNPPIVALTATADPRVRDDILVRLNLRDPVVHVAGFDRPNLRFDVVRVRNQKEKAEAMAEKLKTLKKDDSAIIYCGTRKKVEDLTDFLQRQRIKAARYHAGMEDADRRRIQDAFARDSVRVIVATNAFGMGIDKPDVRMVLHHDLPDSLESYYQEAGRAGRDGDPAECVLYYATRDRGLREFFIDLEHPEPATVVDVYRALVSRQGERTHIRDLMTEEDESGINAAIAALVESGLAGRQGQMAWAVRPDGEDDIDLAGLEEHRAHAYAKLDAMQRYAESMTCLRARILAYFGDENGAAACGNCGPCVAPVAASAGSGDDEDTERLFNALRAVRRRFADDANVPPYVIFADTVLREMARKRPRTRIEMLAVAGVGQVKYERYGEAFLAVTKAAAPVVAPAPVSPPRPGGGRVAYRDRKSAAIPETVQRTWELHRSGLGIEEIAAQRGFSRSTIANHIADLVTRGEITDVSPWIDAATLALVRRAANGQAIGALGVIKEALGESVTYEQLHIARAYLSRPAAAP
ncbi:MAG: RecQ family ATP-dependent DNA helicase [Chloroflexi bacterium]|nr:RecQ family ATP-dependent DNA helicase [Chloroflexota bacterium]